MGEGKSANPWHLASILTVVCVAILGAGGTYVVLASKPERVTAPKSLIPFTAKDKSFTCTYPEGWKVRDGAGQSTHAYAYFSKGGARLRVSSDLQGSLMGDIGKSPVELGGLESMPGAGELGKAVKELSKPPVEKIHIADAGDVKSTLAELGYEKFEDGQMQPYQGKAGDSRISEFTADGGMFMGKIRGFRTTSLGTERRIRVVAYALEEDWAMLKPFFQKAIMSVTPGTPQ